MRARLLPREERFAAGGNTRRAANVAGTRGFDPDPTVQSLNEREVLALGAKGAVCVSPPARDLWLSHGELTGKLVPELAVNFQEVVHSVRTGNNLLTLHS